VSNIDKQRVAAVRKLEQLGYTFAGDWHPLSGACLRNLEEQRKRKSRSGIVLLLSSRCDTLAGHRKTLPVICSIGRSWLAH
jgi:hypothetical protein